MAVVTIIAAVMKIDSSGSGESLWLRLRLVGWLIGGWREVVGPIRHDCSTMMWGALVFGVILTENHFLRKTYFIRISRILLIDC